MAIWDRQKELAKQTEHEKLEIAERCYRNSIDDGVYDEDNFDLSDKEKIFIEAYMVNGRVGTRAALAAGSCAAAWRFDGKSRPCGCFQDGGSRQDVDGSPTRLERHRQLFVGHRFSLVVGDTPSV